MKTLVLTGWGWKEYAAAAAAALDALGGDAEVLGMSRRRLPEFMEGEAADWKRLVARHREMNAAFNDDCDAAAPVAAPDLLDDAIREHVRRVLRKYALNITRAASALGISRTTLRKWI